MNKPYSSSELIKVAVENIPLNPLRVLATYADPNNWTTEIANHKCVWVWIGPVIVGYEFAEQFLRRFKGEENHVYVVTAYDEDTERLGEIRVVSDRRVAEILFEKYKALYKPHNVTFASRLVDEVRPEEVGL